MRWLLRVLAVLLLVAAGVLGAGCGTPRGTTDSTLSPLETLPPVQTPEQPSGPSPTIMIPPPIY